jgi:hypothetical protein
MYLVDDVDLETAARWRVDGILEKLSHLVDLGIGRCVNLEQIDKPSGVDLPAGRADAAGSGGDTSLAVKRLGQNACQCRLANPTRAGKQIGMVQALCRQGMRQCSDNVFLTYQAGKRSRAPLARQDLVTHDRILADGATCFPGFCMADHGGQECECVDRLRRRQVGQT